MADLACVGSFLFKVFEYSNGINLLQDQVHLKGDKFNFILYKERFWSCVIEPEVIQETNLTKSRKSGLGEFFLLVMVRSHLDLWNSLLLDFWDGHISKVEEHVLNYNFYI